MIPNFTSLDEALAQTSANRSNGHQRADVLGRNELVAQHGTALANSTEKPADRDAAASVTRTVRDLLLPVTS
jgi:hypothetical protein